MITVDAMPMTSTGKIQKHLLRQKHAAHYNRDPGEGQP